ncbi:MAG TPA: ANTAR domain-containing protein [Gaiellaceae bacterium]|nr:ANTAR domain-containing protein [Gaiellaceae bacterium]
MDGTTLRIENSTRAHAESLLQLLRTDYDADLVHDDGAWQLEVQVGELSGLLLKLFDSLGSWLDAEQIDSILLHFDERQYVLLRPSKERLRDSNGFLLERVAQLETALQSRVVIEQAKGVIARTLGVSTDQAFSLLRKAARDKGAKLHDLAATIAAAPMQAETALTTTPRDPS